MGEAPIEREIINMLFPNINNVAYNFPDHVNIIDQRNWKQKSMQTMMPMVNEIMHINGNIRQCSCISIVRHKD